MAGAALIVAASCLLALVLGTAVLLRAWQGWLDLKRLRLDSYPHGSAAGEVRQLRDRVRKLERIALGLD